MKWNVGDVIKCTAKNNITGLTVRILACNYGTKSIQSEYLYECKVIQSGVSSFKVGGIHSWKRLECWSRVESVPTFAVGEVVRSPGTGLEVRVIKTNGIERDGHPSV